MQVPSWGDVKPDWRAESLGWFDGSDRLVGVGLLLLRPLPKLKRYLAYLPEGPVVDWAAPDFQRWLEPRLAHLKRLAGSPAAMVTVFALTALPLDRMTYVKQVEGVGTRLTLLWFLEHDPRDRRREHFADLDAAVATSGLGDGIVAPFIPTVPGTDRYVDELRVSTPRPGTPRRHCSCDDAVAATFDEVVGPAGGDSLCPAGCRARVRRSVGGRCFHSLLADRLGP